MSCTTCGTSSVRSTERERLRAAGYEPAVQRSLNRVGHQDLHLSFPEIPNVVIEGPVLELLVLAGAYCLLEPLKPQKVVARQLLRALLDWNLRRGLLELLGGLLVAGL